MAGVSVGESDENPVAINVVAMVDIIFCLCVFFMCSFRFKQLEGKFESWLPKGKGTGGVGTSEAILQDIRVAMFWNPDTQRTERQFQTRRVDDDDELQQLIKDQRDDFVRLGRLDAPVIIDAETRVPWNEVIKVMNMCKRIQIENIEFALGAPPPK
jgi:biopolymer transport protein ExbD